MTGLVVEKTEQGLFRVIGGVARPDGEFVRHLAARNAARDASEAPRFYVPPVVRVPGDVRPSPEGDLYVGSALGAQVAA